MSTPAVKPAAAGAPHSAPAARALPAARARAAPGLRVAPRTRRLRLALAGCGVVGGALLRLLHERAAAIEAGRGLRIEVARILVRDPARPRAVELEPELLTTDPGRLLAEPVDVLIEAIGGLDPAARLARETLGRGRAFVTANKELLATAGAELAALARRTGASFDFEAAVAGGVPVVRALRGSLGETGVLAVRGILNGTSNYLLDRLRNGADYATALEEAQRKGFAEADPARDVDGRDAAAKIRVLAWLAFGTDPATLPVRRRGLLPDPQLLAAAATRFDAVPRLLAECVRLEHGVVAAVEPVAVDPGSELGSVRAEHNLVDIRSVWNGPIRLAGPGAGGAPTASALLSDVLRSAGPLPITVAPAPATTDERRHRWILAARKRRDGASNIAALEHALERARVAVQDRRPGDGLLTLLTAPVTWSHVASALGTPVGPDGAPACALLRDERAA